MADEAPVHPEVADGGLDPDVMAAMRRRATDPAVIERVYDLMKGGINAADPGRSTPRSAQRRRRAKRAPS